MATITKCNMCGNEIEKIDLDCNPFSLRHRLGYGSKYDEDLIELDLCSNCQDKLITYLIENCKINPITEGGY